MENMIHDADPSFLQRVLERARQHRHYDLLNLDNVEVIVANERLTSRCLLGIVCTTREVNIIIVKEMTGDYYMYVFY